jgi:hypothetical protein
MSVFVNLNKFASNVDKTNLEFSALGGTGAIVDNPSNYQVGVARFKIPLSAIPLYRIYENELFLGLSPNSVNSYNGNKIDNYDHSLNRVSMFDGSNLQITTGKYGVDDLNGNKKYVDIFAQEDFVELLNRSLARSFNALAYSQRNEWLGGNTGIVLWSNKDDTSIGGAGTPSINGTTFLQGGTGLGGGATGGTPTTDGVTIVGMTPVGQKNADGTPRSEARTTDMSAPTINEFPTASNTFQGQLIVGIRLDIHSFTRPNNGTTYVGNKPNFSDFIFTLEKYRILANGEVGNHEQTYYFNTSCLDGLTEYDLSNDNSGSFRPGIQPFIDNGTFNIGSKYGVRFGTGEHFQITQKDSFDTRIYDSFTEKSSGTDGFHLFLDETSQLGLIGQRYDGFTYRLCVKNKTYINNPATATAGYTIANGLQLQFNTIPASFIDRRFIDETVPVDGTPTDETEFLMPRFELEQDGRISYNQKPIWSNQLELKIYMNNRLGNLMSFDYFKRTAIVDNTSLKRFFANSNNVFNEIDKGSIYSFPSMLGAHARTALLGKVSILEKDDEYKYIEAVNTFFTRDFLNSVVITTGIPIGGELVGGGDSKRKVLTDFEIDPSSVKRDYLIFTNSGGERFYQLLTTQELREIDLQVNYQDIYGINRRLTLLSGQECSIKLEFRPNNQIANFPHSLSTFDIIN